MKGLGRGVRVIVLGSEGLRTGGLGSEGLGTRKLGSGGLRMRVGVVEDEGRGVGVGRG